MGSLSCSACLDWESKHGLVDDAGGDGDDAMDGSVGLPDGGNPVGGDCTGTGVACVGLAQRERVQCDNGTWRAIEPCSENTVCSTGSSDATCLDVPADCQQRKPGETFCSGDMRRACSADLLSVADDGCGLGRCDEKQTELCQCDPGAAVRERTCAMLSCDEGLCGDHATNCVTSGANSYCSCQGIWTGKLCRDQMPTYLGIESVVADPAHQRLFILERFQLFAYDVQRREMSLVYQWFDTVPSDITYDSANDRVFVGAYSEVFAIDLATKTQTVISGPTRGTGPALTVAALYSLYDGRLLTQNQGALLAIDPATGNRTLLSSAAEKGTGIGFSFPVDLAYDLPRSRLLVSDTNQRAIIAVDLGTGNRTKFADLVGNFFSPTLAIDNQGHLLVAENNGLYEFDLETAASQKISDVMPGRLAYDRYSPQVWAIGNDVFELDLSTKSWNVMSDLSAGTGPRFGLITAEAASKDGNDLYLATTKGIFAIHIKTGNRRIISPLPPAQDDPYFQDRPRILRVDSRDGSLVVTYDSSKLFRVNPADGAHTLIAPLPDAVKYARFALDEANNRVLFAKTGPAEILAIDLANGNQSVLSGAQQLGPAFGTPAAIDIDVPNSRALVTDEGTRSVFAVDLTTGSRVEIAGTELGLKLPRGIRVDSANHRALVSDWQRSGPLLTAIDLTTGAGTQLSGLAPDKSVLGTGILFESAFDIALIEGTSSVVVAHQGGAAMQIDTATGNRWLLSAGGE